jgi:ornithine cyclodeaminase
MTDLPSLWDDDDVTSALPTPAAIEAIRAALAAGLDPSAGPARSIVPTGHGNILLMPAEWGGYAGVKIVTVAPGNPAAGRPLVQGNYLLLDGRTLTPLAFLAAEALTAIRTSAVSAVAADVLAEPTAATLVVFGAGPQARQHVAALRVVRPIREVIVVGRDEGRAAAFARDCEGRVGTPADVASADIVACCTSSRTPVFDGALLRPHTTVIAVGSYQPDTAEVDARTVAGCAVVVEERATALREAGDVIQAVRSALLEPTALTELPALVRGTERIEPGTPRLFKSVGMAWEDLVLVAAAYERLG